MKSRAPVPSCIPTVLSKSAPAIHQVGVRLSSDCMSRSISWLNWILLYAPSRSIATATVSYFLWNNSSTSYANAAAFSHMFSKGIVIESADFMTWPLWTHLFHELTFFAKMVSPKKCMWIAVRMLVSDCINHLWGEPLMTYCSGLEKWPHKKRCCLLGFNHSIFSS